VELKWRFANLTEEKARPFDRIDNHGPYASWNCRWATAKEQLKNTRLLDEAVNERLAEQGSYQNSVG